ncbi:hypothetical protein M9H77_20736 [Catharanthus roseus]|uniref:Uncharacterized protein n=1 Tax=Catharanthus roseus TaxID=4058 RepID=A0ACC0AN94_CATRO|nr:hypothetical protein M9H77_20736 [Catharanthus roseus]
MEGKVCISLFLCFAMAITMVFGQGTRVGFYSTSCPNAESIVESAVRASFQSDRTIAPGIVRMHFHDCFVNGCDGSILIEGANTERTSNFNTNVRDFEVIENAKTQLESACPGVVSCADILALAARDSVVLTGGQTWQVPTGRRDGRVSLASDVSLPRSRDPVDLQIRMFSDKGLNTQDLVALVGAHTIGTTACGAFSYRFTSLNGSADPTIDPTFLSQLQSQCPTGGNGNRVPLDTDSENTFDTSFFTNLQNGRGVLESDQRLWSDTSTRAVIEPFLRITGSFDTQFARSMVKMSNIEVITGIAGEIRRVCSTIN